MPAGRSYPLHEGDSRPPSYDRVVKGLTDEELASEIENGLGDDGFQEALRAEAERRGLATK